MRIKNGLIVGVILLFIGVTVQPAIAVNPISTDNDEDCEICPKVKKTHLVRLKSLINRVETINNKFSVISKHNPEIEEKYQELLSYDYENDNTNGWYPGNIFICIFLWYPLVFIAFMLFMWPGMGWQFSDLLYSVNELGIYLNCDWIISI